MLKKMLKSVLPIALVIAMLFSQSALAAVTVDMVDMATKDDTVAIVLHGAEPNEMVTVLIYEDADADDVFDESENILYIWQVDADENGDATFSATFKAGTVNGAKAVAFGTQNNSNAGYFATDEITVADKLAVTYSLGDATGDAPTQEAVFAGTEITLAAAPAWEGYTFKGWNDGAATYDAGAAYTVNAATTLTAQWEANVVYYTITWKNGEETLKTDSVEAGQMPTYTGETPVKAATPEYTYTFAGWDPEVVVAAADATYTAKFTETANTYTVTWNVNGEKYAETPVAYGASITTPDYTVAEGYNFSGWTVPETMPAENITLDATTTIKTFTVTFVVDGETVDTQTVNYGEAAVAPEVDEKEGYTLSDWDVDFSSVKENLTVTAAYAINSYTVTWNVDGVEYKTTTVVYGEAIVAPEYEVAEGYDFSGWGEVAATMPAQNLTYNATTTIKTFVVTYMNGEDVVYTETVNYGADVQNVPAVPAKEGYTGTWSADGKAIKATTTINAEYEINSYTLAFTINGEAYGEATEVEYNAAIAAPEYTVAEGYTFSGWDVPATMPAQNLTIDATLTVNEYTVTFTINGEDYDAVDFAYGAVVVVPEYEVEEGYTFSGWDVPATMPAEDITIDATLTVNEYTVTFTINGEDYDTVDFAYGAVVVAPEYEVEEGYTFSGWDVPATMPAQDLTIDATLAIQTFTVTWVVENVTVETDEDVAYGTQPTYDGATPTKAEDADYTYTFKEWTPAITTVTGDATYTAVFDTVAKTKYFTASFGDDAEAIKVEQTAEVKTIELPEVADETFAGWRADETFLPAGAEYELTADVDFTAVYVDLTMVNGAAIRLDKTNPGLRFTTNGTKIDGAEYGTLLALDAALESRGLQNTYTIEDIQSFNGNLPEGKTALKCANVKANYFYDEEPMDYRTVMVIEQIDANTNMYDYAWAARSYVTVKYSDNTSKNFYSNVVKRSPKAVATDALANGSYTGDALDVLNVYAGN